MYSSGNFSISLKKCTHNTQPYYAPDEESMIKIANAMGCMINYELSDFPCMYKKGCSTNTGLGVGGIGTFLGIIGLYYNKAIKNSGGNNMLAIRQIVDNNNLFSYRISEDKKTAIMGYSIKDAKNTVPYLCTGYFEGIDYESNVSKTVYFVIGKSYLSFLTEDGKFVEYPGAANSVSNNNLITMSPLVIPEINIIANNVYLIGLYKSVVEDTGVQEFVLNGKKYTTLSTSQVRAGENPISLAINLD